MAPVRCVLFEQSLVSPTTSADDARASLESAGFRVRVPDAGPYGSDGNAWLVAEMVMQSPPSSDDQTALMDRAAEASSRFGFELRQHSVVWGWRERDGGN